jgi:tRNA threonylcarbamoyladenosine biosynthesis protein TsaB
VAIDARRNEIYLAAYDHTGREMIAPCACALAAAVPLVSAQARAWRVGGSAALALAAALARSRVEADVAEAAMWPNAAHMLALVANAALQAAPPRPLYLRAADAKPMTEHGA